MRNPPAFSRLNKSSLLQRRLHLRNLSWSLVFWGIRRRVMLSGVFYLRIEMWTNLWSVWSLYFGSNCNSIQAHLDWWSLDTWCKQSSSSSDTVDGDSQQPPLIQDGAHDWHHHVHEIRKVSSCDQPYLQAKISYSEQGSVTAAPWRRSGWSEDLVG
jgi:hypothetical protein